MNFKKLLIAPTIILVMSSCDSPTLTTCECASLMIRDGGSPKVPKDKMESLDKCNKSFNELSKEDKNKTLLEMSDCSGMKIIIERYEKELKKHLSPDAHIGRWVYDYDNGSYSWSITLKIKKNNEYRMDIIYAIDRKLIIDKGEWAGDSRSFKLYSLNDRGNNMRCEIRNGKLILSQFKKRNGETMEVTLDLN